MPSSRPSASLCHPDADLAGVASGGWSVPADGAGITKNMLIMISFAASFIILKSGDGLVWVTEISSL